MLRSNVPAALCHFSQLRMRASLERAFVVRVIRYWTFFSLFFSIGELGMAYGQGFQPNYDEAKVPSYELPDPLISGGGEKIQDPSQWLQRRRSEILDLFEQHVFGRLPAPLPVEAIVVSTNDRALGGKALRREIDLVLRHQDQQIVMELLIYTPNTVAKCPLFLGLNFEGNHTVEPDPQIRLPRSWVRERNDGSTEGNRAVASGRGKSSDDWPVEMIIDRGYGLATIYYGDIDPDFDDGFQNGIHPLFASWAATVPAGERWGSISAWAYGLSRALDALQADGYIDPSRVAVIGHSRLGKTSLWAGATDPRFKLVISNNSGCGGAALSRRAFGETVGRINTAFPHWFCQNHRKYNENEGSLPVDHHQLIALIAPRAVYVASASEDLWADPNGEFLSCVHADPVYRLLGTNGLGGTSPPATQPPPDQPLQDGMIGYHLRTGAHALTPTDWKYYLDFADRHL